MQERADVWILLAVLFIFSASVGILHGSKKSKKYPSKEFYHARLLR